MATIKDLKFDDKNFNNEVWRKVDGKVISRNKTIPSKIGAVTDIYFFNENSSLFKEQ